MRIVRRYTTPLQAEAAAEFLRQSRIAARTSSRTGVPGLSGYEVFDVAILDDSQADRARELLASIFCPECHYPLAGLATEGLCPECGRHYSKAELLRGPGS